MKFNLPLCILTIALVTASCSKSDKQNPTDNSPKLIVRMQVDPDQQRLGNTGQPESIPAGNAGQNPVFNAISAHYLELAPSAYTALGEGQVLYHAEETDAGGENAIDFAQSKVVKPGEVFLEVPLNSIPAGDYEWVRLSLSYQNYDVTFHYQDAPYTGTLASFVGFNTFIDKYKVKDKEIAVNANRKQGYWAFETIYNVIEGQAPEGATTVPNPLFNSSPIPQGSCVVTGEFPEKLTISGNETEDINITMSLSINKSFEWEDINGNGHWDVDNGDEKVVDMGLRGLVPIVE